MNSDQGHQSFTLVELLIVIAIIGILAAAVIFGVSSARDKAAKARALSDCTNYITAQSASYADTGDYDNTNDTTNCTADSTCCAVAGYVTGMTPPSGWTYACDADALPAGTAFSACQDPDTCSTTDGGAVNGSEAGCR